MPFYRTRDGAVICYVNKCASTAISNNMVAWDKAHGGKYTQNGHVENRFDRKQAAVMRKQKNTVPFYWWVRNPYERLVSGWRFFYKDSPNRMRNIGATHECGFDEFVKAACSNMGQADPHFKTQTEQVSFRGTFCPTKIMRLDDLSHWWEELYGTPFDETYRNPSDRLEVPPEELKLSDEAEALWRKVYRHDIKHYENAEQWQSDA